jgi:early secretory antigenic target protein ESAT-6
VAGHPECRDNLDVATSKPVDCCGGTPPVDNRIAAKPFPVKVSASRRIGGQPDHAGGAMRYEVDSAQVIQAGSAVQMSAQQIREEVDRMMRHLLELQSSWRGQAATSFQSVISDWQATQERVRASLEDIQQALALAGRQYAEVESATAAMFGR